MPGRLFDLSTFELGLLKDLTASDLTWPIYFFISEIVEPQTFGVNGETPSFKKADADLSLIVLSISEINPLALRNASSATIKGAFATASCLASDARNSAISCASLSGSSGIGPNASI